MWYSKDEIYLKYKKANNKHNILKTLAELNACTIEEIQQVVDEKAEEEKVQAKIQEKQCRSYKKPVVEEEPIQDIQVLKAEKGAKNMSKRYSKEIDTKITSMLLEGKDMDSIIIACDLPINGTGSKQKIWKIKRQLIEEGKLSKTDTLQLREHKAKVKESKSSLKDIAKEPKSELKLEGITQEPKPTKTLQVVKSKEQSKPVIADKKINKAELNYLLSSLKRNKLDLEAELLDIQREIAESDRLIKFLEELV